MNLLDVLAVFSFVFVTAFTWHAYTSQPGTGQTPRSAIIEAWINITVGFSINFVANYAVLPLIGTHFTAGQNFAMGWVYTAISVVRQYTIRRWFNARLHAAALYLSGDVK